MSVIYSFILPHPPVVLPEVGLGREADIQKTIDSFKKVADKIAEIKPDTIVISSPHALMYSDYFHISPGKSASGDMTNFNAKDVEISVDYDQELVAEICKEANKLKVHAGTLGEKDKALDHGVVVPIRFINEKYTDYKLVRTGLSGMSYIEHYRYGKTIASAVEKLGRKVVFIASGDLSHKLTDDGPYGFAPEGPEFDRQVTDAMKTGDFYKFLSFSPSFCYEAAECGLRSFIIMAGVLDGKAVKTEFMSYEGQLGVGYAVCGFETVGIDDSRCFNTKFEKEEREKVEFIKSKEDEYVKLARYSLEYFIKNESYAPVPPNISEDMKAQNSGVFVSLKKYGILRGCIGSITSTSSSLAYEIIKNAVLAGIDDPRFDPVTVDELPDIIYSVDVLSKPIIVKSVDELDAKRYGVIVKCKEKRALLLPDLEGIDTVEKQITVVLDKAGISPDENYTIERFEVVRHK